MRIEATPLPAEPERRALLAALGEAEPGRPEHDLYGQPWRLAGLREASSDEADVGYAFSPRSTRGATRA